MALRGLLVALFFGSVALLAFAAPRSGLADDDELSRKEQLKLMKTYTKAMSVKCTHCHVAKKFKVDTPLKKVALHCRDEFEKKLVDAKGKPIKCINCHDGEATFLPDEKVDAYCKDNFVAPLRLAEGKKKIDCATCHGEADKPGKFLPPRE